MPSKTQTARMTGKTALVMVRHPVLRRTTVKAAKPPAKVGWRLGKIVVARKARGKIERVGDQIERVGAAGRTLGSLIVVYGPMAAEVFGLVETPKPKRRAPVFLAGLAIGAGALHVLHRNNSD
jgi:hypothetical protein